MDCPTPKLFFQKNCLVNKIIPKNQIIRRNVFTGKNTVTALNRGTIYLKNLLGMFDV